MIAENQVDIVDWEPSWHDGCLVDIRFGELHKASAHVELLLDLYTDPEPNHIRYRYSCVCERVERVVLNLDCKRLRRYAESVIDWESLDQRKGQLYLTVALLGGTIEIEAKKITMRKVSS